MKTQFLASSLLIVLLSMLFCGQAGADALTGFKDITLSGNALVSLTYQGTEYVVANGDLMLGTTTRWYIPADTKIPTLWVDGAPAPAATVTDLIQPQGSRHRRECRRLGSSPPRGPWTAYHRLTGSTIRRRSSRF
jgi:hypothetical protein